MGWRHHIFAVGDDDELVKMSPSSERINTLYELFSWLESLDLNSSSVVCYVYNCALQFQVNIGLIPPCSRKMANEFENNSLSLFLSLIGVAQKLNNFSCPTSIYVQPIYVWVFYLS